MHRTGGGGLHVIFRHHERVRNSSSKVASGVDVRGEGGFVIWWPAHGCTVADALIAPWPTWLVRRLLKQPKRPEPISRSMLH